jgi:hypothetical protein
MSSSWLFIGPLTIGYTPTTLQKYGVLNLDESLKKSFIMMGVGSTKPQALPYSTLTLPYKENSTTS